MLDFYLSVPVWVWCIAGAAIGVMIAPAIYKRRNKHKPKKGDRHDF